ncbi:MAG TPA: uroporphyrinogen decarboxylase [Steroidobacteraceae bacterium]|nr:uroporphyrinogen decarboxylase [Steroidobacteraceae bacterium]
MSASEPPRACMPEGTQLGAVRTVESTFLAACRRQPVPHRPIWIMRQAGRYLPEYRALRAKVDFERLTRTPELAAEVTLQPLRRFPLDAAILFSDIMTPIQGMGVGLSFEPAPVVREPIRSMAQVEALPPLAPARDVPFVLESIRLIRAALPGGVPLIGFAGAPFTLMCYLVCGRPSKEFAAARSFLYAQAGTAQRLLTRLADAMAEYLAAQAAAGAQALMLFESWAGLLAPREFVQFALPAVRRTVAALRQSGVPLIYYVNQGATLLPAVASLEVEVVGVDWRSPLSQVRNILGPDKAVQGNLDPAALFAAPDELRRHVDAVLEEAGRSPGHIFNLGHGIWPDTDPDAVARLVDYVHERC